MSAQMSDFTTAVSAIIQEAEDGTEEHGFDEQLLNRAVEQLQALSVETEEDRVALLAGFILLVETLIPHAPEDRAASLEEQRQQMQATFDQLYRRENSPYVVTVRITATLAEALKQGGSAEELAESATKELAELSPESDADAAVAAEGVFRVIAMTLAHAWFSGSADGGGGDDPIMRVVGELGEALRRDGFDRARIFNAAAAVAETDGELQAILNGLLHVWGMGLLLRPEAAPSLEPLRDLVQMVAAKLSPEEGAQEEEEEATPPQPAAARGAQARYDEILSEMKTLLERDGFSLYAGQQAMAAIKEVPTESDEELLAMYDTMIRMCDISMPYAEGEGAQMLVIMRSMAEKTKALVVLDEIPELTADELRAQAEALLSEMKQSLETEEFPSMAIMRAMTNLQLLGMQMGREDEESARALFGVMQQVLMALQPYIPEGTENVFNEMTPFMNSMTDALDVDRDDEAAVALFEAEMGERLTRFRQSATAQAETQEVENEVGHIPHIRQFASLLQNLQDRMKLIQKFQDESGEQDKAETERLRERLNQMFQSIRFAYTEEQFIRHQREALRAAVLALRQYERRRHLMILRPAFPSNEVTVDPNDVFFSGTDEVGALVKQACETIGMTPSAKHGLQNRTHGRWQQLRGSGVAVFDYSAYDPATADPRGAVRRSRKGEEKVLGAAGAVASVAYENGWAYALGTPMVIVARKGQAVPFDVDIEPVLLEDDGGDAERIIAAIQTAFYGAQHGLGGDCLAETLEQARKLYGGRKDTQVKKLLSSLADADDAARVRMILSSVVERLEGEKPLLVFPTFPGSYPPEGRRELFHVTAFRSWSKGLEDEARAACARAGVEYRIGKERLNPDIVRVIWRDICSASFVIADITNLNPNAVMELAMAQAAGRPTLVLTRNSQPHTHLPAVQKVRTHFYDPDKGRGDLSALLDAFIAGEG